jgi:hypothetical protein
VFGFLGPNGNAINRKARVDAYALATSHPPSRPCAT